MSAWRGLAWLLGLCLLGTAAQAEVIVLENPYSRLEINTERAAIVAWETCYRPCATLSNPAYRQQLVAAQAPLQIELAPAEGPRWQLAEAAPERLRLQRGANPEWQLMLDLTGPYQLAIEWRRPRADRGVPITLYAPANFEREAGEGFAASHERVVPIAAAATWQYLDEATLAEAEHSQLQGFDDWGGYRNRFWSLLARAENASWRFEPGTGPGGGHWRLEAPAVGRLQVYAGPLSYNDLQQADAALTSLLFDGLWFWMRWLSLGMLFLLNSLAALIGHWGLAVLALSLAVKILMTPLNRIADRWQAQVNRIQSQLHPEIVAIKREFRGEEQANRIMAAHKAIGVSPFYTFKSAFGFLIQIPVFIAAFNVLNEAIGLSGAGLLWIDDLALPDRWLALPFELPFFGGYLNLLPVLMTLVTLLASWQFSDPSLSVPLKARQQRNLYWMALLFFVLFYTFPAAMVLYWTMNNLLQYLKDTLTSHRQGLAD